MFSTLRVPEKLFAIARWTLSLVFAGFLIGLGGRIVGDLPGVDRGLSLQEFMNPAQRVPLTRALDSLGQQLRSAQEELDRARQQLTVARNRYAAQRETFNAWIATRTATTDPQQDPEVLARTRALDSLKAAEREAEAHVERLDAQLITTGQTIDARQRSLSELEASSRGSFERARFGQELSVFAIRLALTLPLLLIAGWLIARKRKSEYWPLWRGFVLFALFAFFVELVPYLPSYGGYVRYTVGIILTAVAGVYLIRTMRRYLAQRALVEQQSEPERRRALPYDEALRRIRAGVCPGCERGIAGAPGSPSSYCVHCGLHLFNECGRCHARKNAFYPYCPSCGVDACADLMEAAPA